MSDYHCLGPDLSPEAYALEETKNFHKALDKSDYTSYIRSFKCLDPRFKEHIEGVEFGIKTSAFSKSNILNTERTCVVFAKDNIPAVFALRKDFPREMLHVNLLPKDLPVGLCLYQEPYFEVRIRLTWEMFIEDIHLWYKRASDGTAHLPNQALEPLILDGMPLLVSNKFYDQNKIYVASDCNGFKICAPVDWTKELQSNATVLIPISTRPTISRCIHYAPQTFKELLEITQKLKVNLREKLSLFTWQIEQLLEANIPAGNANEALRKRMMETECQRFSGQLSAITGGLSLENTSKLQGIIRQITNTASANREEARKKILSWIPMIWFKLPKKRYKNSKEEWTEDIAFIICQSLGVLCAKTGIYITQNGNMIHEKALVGSIANSLTITDDIANVVVVKPIPALEVSMAQKMSGIKKDKKKYLAVGAGALGSQVITNLARLGIGNWDILDHDILLPHNLGRHALFAEHTPSPKAAILADQLNFLMDDPDFSKHILCNFLEHKDSIADYDLIFDFSASTAVVRCMAIRSERPAILSAFMTQNGRYLLCLSEDKEKSVRVDDIEYQLACACISNKELYPVLEVHDEQEIRYSGACSDITTVLPQDRVAVHSGILSSYIKQNTDISKPIISIWELSDDCLVKRHSILPSKTITNQVEGWDIRISEEAIQKMIDYRSVKLPVETGGVLIGGFDFYNKIVYIVDVIPSPKDSIEEPYSYIRGFKGLSEKVEKIINISGRRLDYVGEWHTHLGNTTPSHLDILALNEQAVAMTPAGLPGIMIIVGNKGKLNIQLKQE